MRKAEIVRKTGETDITLSLDIDGKGESEISSGVGFLGSIIKFVGFRVSDILPSAFIHYL